MESDPVAAASAAAAADSSSDWEEMIHSESNHRGSLSEDDDNSIVIPTDNNDDTMTGTGTAAQYAGAAELDDILAKTMNELTLKEREEVFHDLHGVSDVHPEEPNFIQGKLKELDTCLIQYNIPTSNSSNSNNRNNKEAYNRALYMAPNYVQDEKFRLLFLRSEDYDPIVAAERMVKHFCEKLRLFGLDSLVQDITLDDLNENDMKALQRGFHQILPIRDRADRAVLCVLPMLMGDIPHESRLRAYWYSVMTSLRDNETQKKGLVVVMFNVGPNRIGFEEVGFIRKLHGSRESIPAKIAGAHFCIDDKLAYSLIYVVTMFFGKKLRARLRPHFAKTHSEHIYELQTYGIPTQVLPIDENRNPVMDYHLDWLERRKTQESMGNNQQQEHLILPRRFDVLFGKGKTIAEHTGNLRALHIVEMNRNLYEQAGKFEKTHIAERIVHLINQSYGRFLKLENGGWVEVSNDAAREKISHYFRRLRESEANNNGGSNNNRNNGKPGKTATKRDTVEAGMRTTHRVDGPSTEMTEGSEDSSAAGYSSGKRARP